jgi:hypothetical protein
MSRSSPDFGEVSEQEIFLRAYTHRADVQEEAGGGDTAAKPKRQRVGPSDVSLIFDVETTTDASQRMRFLVYQLRIGALPSH